MSFESAVAEMNLNFNRRQPFSTISIMSNFVFKIFHFTFYTQQFFLRLGKYLRNIHLLSNSL